jgi:hypothetical protein
VTNEVQSPNDGSALPRTGASEGRIPAEESDPEPSGFDQVIPGMKGDVLGKRRKATLIDAEYEAMRAEPADQF